MKGTGSTGEVHWKLVDLSIGEASGIPSVAVKCVDIRRNTSGEGIKSDVKGTGSTGEVHWKLVDLSIGEASGIPSVAVKCVDIRRNTSGEGGLLDKY